MATATAIQSNGIEFRSVELAEARGMTAGAARFYVGRNDGTELWSVKSRTNIGESYMVTYDPRTDTVMRCSCPSYGACWHMGVTRMRVERRKSLTAPVDAPVAPRVVPVLTPCPTCGGRGWVTYRRSGYRHELACLDCNRARVLVRTA